MRLNRPYKITTEMRKKYDDHYLIPSSRCLIVPLKKIGEAVSCDVRWQEDTGEMQVRNGLMFSISNLDPLDQLREFELVEMFKHYYQVAD